MANLDEILKDAECYYSRTQEKNYKIVKDLRNTPLFSFDAVLKFAAMYKYESTKNLKQ